LPSSLLNVPEPVTYKLCVMVHSCLQGQLPRSTWSTSAYQSPASLLGSISGPPIDDSFTHASPVANVYGRLAFSVAGSSAWNLLPDNLRDPTPSVTRDSFRQGLTQITMSVRPNVGPTRFLLLGHRWQPTLGHRSFARWRNVGPTWFTNHVPTLTLLFANSLLIVKYYIIVAFD